MYNILHYEKHFNHIKGHNLKGDLIFCAIVKTSGYHGSLLLLCPHHTNTPVSPGCFFLLSSKGIGFLDTASLTACLSFLCSFRYFLAVLCCLNCLFFNLLSSFILLVFNSLRKLGTRFLLFLWRR